MEFEFECESVYLSMFQVLLCIAGIQTLSDAQIHWTALLFFHS